jgi:hypothetical protein
MKLFSISEQDPGALPRRALQRIRLVFDQPQSIRRMRLQFNESDVARTQEFTARWSGRPDEPLKGGRTAAVELQSG